MPRGGNAKVANDAWKIGIAFDRPIHIYDGGMLVAQLGEGATRVGTKLEIGRREIEIRSGHDNRVLFRGDLNVDQNHKIQLAVGDQSPPRPTVRPWLWQGY